MFDPIAVLEAAYAPHDDDAAWLDAVGGALAPALDRGLGSCAYIIDASSRSASTFATRGEVDDVTLSAVKSGIGAPGAQRAMCSADPFGICSSRTAFGTSGAGHPGPARDTLALLSLEANRWLTVFLAGSARHVPITSHDSAMFKRLSVHIAAALRLRRLGDRVEAVLDPDGKVAHATARAAEAREELRAATRHIDQARSRSGRADADTALELWQGLVMGRWTLVDRFDSDGRRYVLACRNTPTTGRFPMLTRREQQVVFYISLGQSLKQTSYASASRSRLRRPICARRSTSSVSPASTS